MQGGAIDGPSQGSPGTAEALGELSGEEVAWSAGEHPRGVAADTRAVAVLGAAEQDGAAGGDGVGAQREGAEGGGVGLGGAAHGGRGGVLGTIAFLRRRK